MEIINTILKQMFNISKPQQKFEIVILTTLIYMAAGRKTSVPA